MLLSVKDFIKKNRFFSAVCFVEMLLILMLLLHSIITPASTLEINPVNFMVNDSADVSFENGQLIFNAEKEVSVGSTMFPIGYGAYEVVINYSSTPIFRNPYQTFSATLDFSAENIIKTERIYLYDEQTSVTTRVWIPFLNSCRAFRAALVYYGSGEFVLESIRLTESIPFRFCRTLGFALLMLLADLFYWLFFSNSFSLNKKQTYGLLLTLTAFIASLPYFSDLLFDGHDLPFHLNRIAAVAEGLKNGQFPVRLYTAQNGGYGYAAPLFYCDLFLYLPALLYNCLLPARTCYQFYVICINAATVFLTYFCFSRITKDKQMGLIGSILYSLCTYRLTNIFVRAAVGEYTAMVFLPLIVLGMYRIYMNDLPDWHSWLPLSLGVAGVLMSHVITMELVLFNLIVICLLLWRKTFKSFRLIAILKAAGLCLLLTAWFWLPFLESFLTETVRVQQAENDLAGDALFLVELFSIFTNGSGLSATDSMMGGMPLTIGMSLVIGLFLIVVCILKRTVWKTGVSGRVLQLLLLMSGVNLIFTLRIFPWDYVNIFSGIQFPWRFLSIASLLLVVATVFALALIRSRDTKAFQRCIAVLAAAVFISTGSLLFENSHNSEEFSHSTLSSHAKSDHLYLPLEGDRTVVFTQPFPFSNDGVSITNFARNGHQTQFNAFNPGETSASVIVPLYFYNHYQATDDSGTGIPVSRSTDGRVQLTLPAHYEGSLSVSHVPPIHWHVAEAVSAASWLALAVFALKNRKKA